MPLIPKEVIGVQTTLRGALRAAEAGGPLAISPASFRILK